MITMKNIIPNLPAAAMTLAALIVLSIEAPLPVGAQEPPAAPSQVTVGGVKITGIPNDWSFRHVVFSNAGTEEEAIGSGKHDEWLRIVNEPRYVIQQLHRHAAVQGPAAAQVAALEAQTAPAPEPDTRSGRKTHKDWSEGVGDGGNYVDANIYPAKWSFYPAAASCNKDFVVYPTASSSTQASIIAYNNLYSGCSSIGTVPSVYWAYNTGGDVALSPALSIDGSQIAVVQYSTTTGTPSLVLLKWAPSATETLTSPGTPTGVSASAYPGCTAPCMTSIPFSGSGFDYTSDPYYDYGTDSVYVGDSVGNLHKFHPIFNGVPTEVTVSGWPVSTGYYELSSPVYDPVSGCVFVGSVNAGSFFSVNSGTPGTQCTGTNGSIYGASNPLSGYPYLSGIADAPLLDPVAGTAYTFVQDNYYYYKDCEIPGPFGCQEYINEYEYQDAVIQFPTSFAGTGYYPTTTVGLNSVSCVNSCGYPVWSGAFDNVYFESSAPASPSGHLYVAGTSPNSSVLSQLTITGNSVTNVVLGPTLGLSGYVSPITEFCNNSLNACASDGTNTISGTDYIFVSVLDGAAAGCIESDAYGCVMSYAVDTPSSFNISATPNSPLNVPATFGISPTTGIIIDNSVGSGTLPGASQIYFLTLDSSATCGNGAAGLCATQASQSAP